MPLSTEWIIEDSLYSLEQRVSESSSQVRDSDSERAYAAESFITRRDTETSMCVYIECQLPVWERELSKISTAGSQFESSVFVVPSPVCLRLLRLLRRRPGGPQRNRKDVHDFSTRRRGTDWDCINK
jgi:hypothetical protein